MKSTVVSVPSLKQNKNVAVAVQSNYFEHSFPYSLQASHSLKNNNNNNSNNIIVSWQQPLSPFVPTVSRPVRRFPDRRFSLRCENQSRRPSRGAPRRRGYASGRWRRSRRARAPMTPRRSRCRWRTRWSCWACRRALPSTTYSAPKTQSSPIAKMTKMPLLRFSFLQFLFQFPTTNKYLWESNSACTCLLELTFHFRNLCSKLMWTSITRVNKVKLHFNLNKKTAPDILKELYLGHSSMWWLVSSEASGYYVWINFSIDWICRKVNMWISHFLVWYKFWLLAKYSHNRWFRGI